MQTPQFSDLPDQDTALSVETTAQNPVTAPKTPYEAPQLTNYGQLKHLTMQNISGGGDKGDI